MCGIAPYHIQLLCKSGWEGGFGYHPSQVGELTLDEIFMLLADSKNLRRHGEKIRSIESLEGVRLVRKDGYIHGRSASGELIKGQIKGQSLAFKLRAEAEEKRKLEAEKVAKEAAEKTNSRRRRRRG